MSNQFAPRPLPNDVIPIPVGTQISPLIAPYVAQAPLVEDKQATPNPLFKAPPAGQRGAAPFARLQGMTAPRLDRNYQRNLTTLTNKYEELSPLLAEMSPVVRQALINFDARRVASGSAPLTKEQSVLAAQTAETGEPATPEPDRSPFGIFGNIGKDLTDIVKAIPRLPYAIYQEIKDLPNMGTRIAEAQAAGANPLSAILEAPGIRMLPGAFTLSRVVEGDFSDLAEHPLMTALDVLPYASVAAAGTGVARAVRLGQLDDAAELAARLGREVVPRPNRPLSAVLTNRLTPTGVERNLLGHGLDLFRTNTRPGQALESAFGRRAREVASISGKLDQRAKSLLLGLGKPVELVERFGPEIADLFDRYADAYPSLGRKAIGPEHDAWRAGLYKQMQLDPTKFDPGFVGELRDVVWRIGRYAESEGLLGIFDNEFFPTEQAAKLRRAEMRANHSQRMYSYRNEYMNPSGGLTSSWFRTRADEILDVADDSLRIQQARALEMTLDAYGIDPAAIQAARGLKGSWGKWHSEISKLMAGPTRKLSPRTSLTDIIQTLRSMGADRQATLLEEDLRLGARGKVSERLKNLYARKVPNTNLTPQFRDDAASMGRRIDFDNTVGKRYSDKRVTARKYAFERRQRRTMPARFQPLVEHRAVEELQHRAETAIGHTLTPEEAALFAENVELNAWKDLPGIDPVKAPEILARIRTEIGETWRDLRAAGHDPIFVHRVSPSRARGLTRRVGPQTTGVSQAKERFDLDPGVQDLQVALTHQAAELLRRNYTEKFIDELITTVGKSEAELIDQYRDIARFHSREDFTMSPGGHLSETIKRAWTKFDPDGEGLTWGGAALDKYRDPANVIWIPKSIANNLKRYVPRDNFFTAISDPITGLFRYNVIGLSPSILINNFFSNSVAMTAEVGLRPWKHWNKARAWLRDMGNPEIPEELRAMLAADAPHLEHLGHERWLKSRTGQTFVAGLNGGQAFIDSAGIQGVKAGKRFLDSVVEKSLAAQRWGDNVYRSMIYLDQMERGALKGVPKAQAEATAMELVRRTLVDYAQFTPIERSALRTIIPFYSYMGHAARFIARYPLNHPMRAAIAASIARAEKERLGALPGNPFLSMWPVTGIGPAGEQTFFNLRPFDPFGDTASLTSVAGWVAAFNPVIQVALRQIGVIRGEAEIYPTLRYDPETGRMRAVRGNPLADLFHTVLPRAGVVTSLLGLNPDFNELAARDPDSAKRNLLSQAGVPRLWREYNIPQEMFKAELTREQSANDVLNQALRTGDWSEALRYPSLRPYYAQLSQLTPEQIAAMQPASPDDIAAAITQQVGS